MTKKNATKRVARERQKRYGGSYMHHFHVASGDGCDSESSGTGVMLAVTTDRLVWIAREHAPKEILRLKEKFGDDPLVYVAVDPADPTGEAIAAQSIAAEEEIAIDVALKRVRSGVKDRTATRRNVYGELMTWPALRSLLEQCLPPGRQISIARLGDRFTAPAPRRHVHVLAVAAGDLRPDSVPEIELCLCGHPVAEHDERGACTFLGVPDDAPFLGLPNEMVKFARLRGIPMRCACAGSPMAVDAHGNVRPLGPAILVGSRD